MVDKDKDIAVFGMYKNLSEAESAIEQIVESRTVAGGFTHHDISVLLSEATSAQGFLRHNNAHAAEGTNAGAASAGEIWAALGLTAAAGAVASPGLGPFIAAGQLKARLAGWGLGGTVGNLYDALVNLGLTEFDAKRYEGRVNGGGVLVAVHCDTPERVARAGALLLHTGADNVTEGQGLVAPPAGTEYRV